MYQPFGPVPNSHDQFCLQRLSSTDEIKGRQLQDTLVTSPLRQNFRPGATCAHTELVTRTHTHIKALTHTFPVFHVRQPSLLALLFGEEVRVWWLFLCVTNVWEETAELHMCACENLNAYMYEELGTCSVFVFVKGLARTWEMAIIYVFVSFWRVSVLACVYGVMMLVWPFGLVSVNEPDSATVYVQAVCICMHFLLTSPKTVLNITLVPFTLYLFCFVEHWDLFCVKLHLSCLKFRSC